MLNHPYYDVAIATLKNLLKIDIAMIEQVGGGRNSQVFILKDSQCNKRVAKFYYSHPLDQRSRLGTEFKTLQFLWKHHVCCIPKPIIKDDHANCAVYEYVPGIKKNSNLKEVDIIQAAKFLKRLKHLKNTESSKEFTDASEAFFSIKGIISNIELRLKKLLALNRSNHNYKDLNIFLKDLFMPSFKRIIVYLKQQDLDFQQNLSHENRTLSPSDFGFHNAIYQANKGWVFIDFEYFGWDDPAKMVSDFLLHPGMNLNEKSKLTFWKVISKEFRADETFIQRFLAVYPLCGLKWCLILLNEFVPEYNMRRTFSSTSQFEEESEQIQNKQLLKAKNMLKKVMDEYEQITYR